MKPRGHALLLVSAILLSGCTPFGHKSEPRELFPADSLSRKRAESVLPEPLVLNWRRDGGENAYFSSIVVGVDSVLWVGDLGRHAVRRFTTGGEELEPRSGFPFPYLAGLQEDTVALYDAGSNRLMSIDDTNRTLRLPPLDGKTDALARQVAISNGAVYVKDASPPFAFVRKLSPSGAVDATFALPGPTWHHFGVLRAWRGKVVSASSYRPIVYVLDPLGSLDSLRLEGFDSPMLARIRAYEMGTVDEPPLVISGLFGTRKALYVLNVRPGVIRVDVFDLDLRLRRILAFEEPKPNAYTPVDLVVRSDGDSTRVFVASVSPVYGALSLHYASRLDRFAFSSPAPGN